MSISSISASTSTYQTTQTNPFAKLKEDFETLGKALQSGNLADAKTAYAQLQKDTPTKSGSDSSPMSTDIASLGKALDSGDVKAAQDIYTKIQDKMSQGASAGKQASDSGQSGGTKPSSSSSSDSSTVYDKKDTNKDGTVSLQEELAYALKHVATSTEATTDTTTSSDTTTGGIISTTV